MRESTAGERVFPGHGIEPSRFAKDVVDALDRLPRGSTSVSDISEHMDTAVERGWVYATLMLGEAQVRTGHVVLGALKTKHLNHELMSISKEFGKIRGDTLAEEFADTMAVNGLDGVSDRVTKMLNGLDDEVMIRWLSSGSASVLS